MPGAFGVRGGFDSHAFPPSSRRRRPGRIVALVLALALAALAPQARAQADGGADSARVEVVPRRARPAAADTARKRPWHEQPRFVMARSLVVPGWGQLHNGAWIKAIGVAAGEGYMISRIVDDQRALDDFVRRIEALPEGDERDQLIIGYNDRFDQRLGRQWLLGALVAYSLIDAYVDANFRGFDVEFQNDPALPGGPGSLPHGSGNRAGVRLLLRRHF